MPDWLIALSWIALALGVGCALAIVLDVVFVARQQMAIMNVVWPITALYSGPLGLWAYYRLGRLSTRAQAQQARADGAPHPENTRPFWESTAVATTHCGAGCTLGDLCAEGLLIVAPLVLFGRKIFGAWVVDYAFAYAFGIVIQYFTIAPMRHLGPGAGLWAAVKADTLSLTAWQVGMYGWMAIVTFGLFGRELEPTSPVFWFMMQVAMLAGFLTSYPVNWWLLRAGIKEPM